MLLYVGGLVAATYMHELMLGHILRAPMQFFDQTPIGRIINRFSKDIDTMDNVLIRSVTVMEHFILHVQYSGTASGEIKIKKLWKIYVDSKQKYKQAQAVIEL